MPDNSPHQADSTFDRTKENFPSLNHKPLMNYTNLDSRLKLHSLSPDFLRRLKRIRAASLKARTANSKKTPPASSSPEAVPS